MAPTRSKCTKENSKSKSKPKNVNSVKAVEPLKQKDNFVTRPSNIVKCFDGFQRGSLDASRLKKSAGNLVAQHLKRFEVNYVLNLFDRRITAICWHPTKPPILVIGSKGGDLAVCSGNVLRTYYKGIGPGGSITSIAFDPYSSEYGFTSSIDGTVKKWHLESLDFETLLDTKTFEIWYCSVNASGHLGLAICGDTKGVLTILSKDLKILSTLKLHKGKINSIDFCKKSENLVATSSNDNTVKLWDMRKIREGEPLHILQHSKPINNALFNLTDGNRLLTTDQHHLVNVYTSPLWHLERSIVHPHRQFQHLTPIRASWHPLSDLIAIGRYPDVALLGDEETNVRSVDVFSAESGLLTGQLVSPLCNGIISLNVFNPAGDTLASGMGLFAPVWKFKPPREREQKTDTIPPCEPLTKGRKPKLSSIKKSKK